MSLDPSTVLVRQLQERAFEGFATKFHAMMRKRQLNHMSIVAQGSNVVLLKMMENVSFLIQSYIIYSRANEGRVIFFPYRRLLVYHELRLSNGMNE